MFQKSENNSRCVKISERQAAVVPYFIIIGLSIIVAAVLGLLPAIRVGDGSEYYALYLAFETNFRPWMTDQAFSAYQSLVDAKSILGLVPADQLAAAFPALKNGETADFNHFWFYSLLAYLVGGPLTASPHHAFLILHGTLLALPALMAFHYYRWLGFLTFILFSLSSPLVWFANKAHTEFLTYCMGMAAVLAVLRVRFVIAALFMAVASTQNPSFALIAGMLLCFRVFRFNAARYSFWEVVGIVSTVLIVLMHPIYYFLRFGVPTPQLLAGGADIGSNLKYFYIWLFDPDVGLLPNWPAGIALSLLGLVALRTCRIQERLLVDRATFWLFMASYLFVSVYSHSSTSNLNSGATVYVARYALWYIPLFFPLALFVANWLSGSVASRVIGLVAAFPFLLGTLVVFFPAKYESYTRPTSFSYYMQTRLAGLYDPPPEIFLERFSGVGESAEKYQVRAVVGPDCKKLLFVSGSRSSLVTAPGHCLYDQNRLIELLERRMLKPDSYYFLSDEESRAASISVAAGVLYEFKRGGNGGFALGQGWGGREDWGVWSEGAQAELHLPCTDVGQIDLTLTAGGFVYPARASTSIEIFAGGTELWSGRLTGTAEIPLSIPASACVNGSVDLSLFIENPQSPAEAGLSNDARMLGIALISFSIRE